MSAQPTITIQGGVATNGGPPNATTQVPPNGWSLDGLFFDSWLTLHHSNSVTITQHPVETGAAISDHAYVNPKRFSFDIGITNSLGDGQFSSFTAAPTRAINAYAALQNRLENRTPMILVCKYGTYDNILIESLDAADDASTIEASKFQIGLVEILRADTRSTKVTRLAQTVNRTSRGQVSGELTSTLYDLANGFGVIK